MASPKTDFNEFAELQNLKDGEFPFAKLGPKLQSRAITWSIWCFVTGIIYQLYTLLAHPTLVNAQWLRELNNNDVVRNSGVNLRVLVLKTSDTFILFLKTVLILLFIVALFMIAVYVMNLVRRSRMFERDMWSNDATSTRIHQKTIQSLQINDQIKRLRQQMNEAQQRASQNSSLGGMFSSHKPSIDDQARLDALRAFKDMHVYVNTRQSTMGDEILKTYQIVFERPGYARANEEFDKLTANISDELSQHTRDNDKSRSVRDMDDEDGRATDYLNFGDRILSDDRRYYYFGPESIIVPDKYAAPEVDESANKPKEKYETSFDLAHFGDQREKIAGIKKKAKAYAKQETSTVEMLLLTKGIEANRNGVKVGAMSVTFSFSLPRKASSALDREGLADAFDSNFRTSGTSVTMAAGGLNIDLPLPKQLRMPIDTASLYRDAFF